MSDESNAESDSDLLSPLVHHEVLHKRKAGLRLLICAESHRVSIDRGEMSLQKRYSLSKVTRS